MPTAECGERIGSFYATAKRLQLALLFTGEDTPVLSVRTIRRFARSVRGQRRQALFASKNRIFSFLPVGFSPPGAFVYSFFLSRARDSPLHSVSPRASRAEAAAPPCCFRLRTAHILAARAYKECGNSASLNSELTRGEKKQSRETCFSSCSWRAVAVAVAPEAITKSAAAPVRSARRLPRRGASRKNTARRRPVVLCEASSMAARFVDCLT